MPLNLEHKEVPHRFQMDIDVQQQPNETTCGPTALQAVYKYFGLDIPLETLIKEVHSFEDGGTLAVWLGCHALSQGFDAVLYSCNLQLLDPSWFSGQKVDLVDKLTKQLKYKNDYKLQRTSQAFIDFIKLGGHVELEDVSRELLRKYLSHGLPILTGLSNTFLYREKREVPPEQHSDDLRGVPTGHFVVLSGYDREKKLVYVSDPMERNPYSARRYEVHIDRVICSILLGVLTYDANFLVIRKKKAGHAGDKNSGLSIHH